MKREEKNFLVCHTTNWLSCFRDGKFAFHLQRVFPWQLFSLSLESCRYTLESRGKVTRLPSVNSSSHACMQKMKEALKLISRPLRRIVYRRLQRRRSIFQSVFFLFARKIAPRVQWSEAWGNFQDSEIETRFTANYWLNLISSREKSPKKDKTSSKIFSFARSIA